jgi:hypothetical protein
VNSSACGRGLVLQSHHQIHQQSGVWSAIVQVADQHELCPLTRPTSLFVDEPKLAQHRYEAVEFTVKIAYCDHTFATGRKIPLNPIVGKHRLRSKDWRPCQRDTFHKANHEKENSMKAAVVE